MFPTRTAALVIPAALLLSLTGCFGGGSGGTGGSGDTPEEPAAAGDNKTACISGKTWVLDLNDLASQLASQLSSNGLNVTQSESAGRQTFTFDQDGTVTSTVDVTYTITIVNDDLTLTLVQTQGGDPGGEWAWLGDSTTVTFANWDNAGYSVQNQMLVNGVASDNQITIPSDTLGGTNMETECSGSTLSTHVVSSPFTQHWSAEG